MGIYYLEFSLNSLNFTDRFVLSNGNINKFNICQLYRFQRNIKQVNKTLNIFPHEHCSFEQTNS